MEKLEIKKKSREETAYEWKFHDHRRDKEPTEIHRTISTTSNSNPVQMFLIKVWGHDAHWSCPACADCFFVKMRVLIQYRVAPLYKSPWLNYCHPNSGWALPHWECLPWTGVHIPLLPSLWLKSSALPDPQPLCQALWGKSYHRTTHCGAISTMGQKSSSPKELPVVPQ